MFGRTGSLGGNLLPVGRLGDLKPFVVGIRHKRRQFVFGSVQSIFIEHPQAGSAVWLGTHGHRDAAAVQRRGEPFRGTEFVKHMDSSHCLRG